MQSALSHHCMYSCCVLAERHHVAACCLISKRCLPITITQSAWYLPPSSVQDGSSYVISTSECSVGCSSKGLIALVLCVRRRQHYSLCNMAITEHAVKLCPDASNHSLQNFLLVMFTSCRDFQCLNAHHCTPCTCCNNPHSCSPSCDALYITNR